MDSKNTSEYLGLVTSQHRQKTKFIECIKVAVDPIVGCQNLLSKMSELHDLETATGDFLRRLIKAKILKNKSTGNINESKAILELALNHSHFKVFDNKDMTVTFKNLATQFTTMQRILVQMFFPLPAGVELIIED